MVFNQNILKAKTSNTTRRPRVKSKGIDSLIKKTMILNIMVNKRHTNMSYSISNKVCFSKDMVPRNFSKFKC